MRLVVTIFLLSFQVCGRNLRVPTETQPDLSDMLTATRLFCGALIMPTIATVMGKIMFGSVHSNFQRTLLVIIFSEQ